MNCPDHILHYTLNTGHTRVSPRAEVADDIIRLLRPLLSPGRHDTPKEGYFVDVANSPGSAFLFTALRATQQGQVPLLTCAVAAKPEHEEVWAELEKLYFKITELPGIRSADFKVPRKPEELPWLAALLVHATPEEALWLADFSRCLAWAWLESLEDQSSS